MATPALNGTPAYNITTSAVTSISFAYSNSGQIIIVAFVFGQQYSSAPTGLGITYNGVSLTAGPLNPTTAQSGRSDYTLHIFYLTSPATGSNTLAASWTNSCYGGMFVSSWDNVDTTALGTAGNYSEVNNIPWNNDPSTSVTSATGDLVLDFFYQQWPYTGRGLMSDDHSPAQWFFDNVDDGNDGLQYACLCASYLDASASSTSVSMTNNESNAAYQAMRLVQSSGGGGGLSIPVAMHHRRQQGLSYHDDGEWTEENGIYARRGPLVRPASELLRRAA